MSTSATVDEVMAELEDNFGIVASKDTLLSRFLLSEQEPAESIVDWGLRLEELMMQVTRKTAFDEGEKRFMLRKRFWRGLRSEELKNATRVHFEGGLTYEELRNKVREEEYEIQISKEKGGRPKQGKVYQTKAEVEISACSICLNHRIPMIQTH